MEIEERKSKEAGIGSGGGGGGGKLVWLCIALTWLSAFWFPPRHTALRGFSAHGLLRL